MLAFTAAMTFTQPASGAKKKAPLLHPLMISNCITAQMQVANTSKQQAAANNDTQQK